MSEYVILTDSATDLPEKLVKELEIQVVPIAYNLEGKEYKNLSDHSEYPVKDFYQTISGGAKVSTSALNPSEIREFIEPFLKDGKDVIYLAFSSGLSCIYQNACTVVRELSEDYPDRKAAVIDSRCASLGFGLYVYLCVQKKKAGMKYDDLLTYAEELKQRICHEFTVDDLGQLKRGGRISPATAFFGSMLQIKPVLYVSPEGKLVPYAKVRGRNASVKMLADKIIAEADKENETPIFIGHGDCIDDAEALKDMIKKVLPEKTFMIDYIGPVIGAHSGYKTLAVFCVAKDRGAERENGK